jgi:UDP-glucose 4-epimerase
MRIFLTGASGFVGSFFLKNILSSGVHEVAVLLRTPESALRIDDLLSDTKIIEGNLSNQSSFEAKVKNFEPEAFVHLAWNGVMGSDRNALFQWRNVTETLELVELASRVGAKHWIGLGSQAEYGPCQNKIDETINTRPTTLYGVSKLAACTLSERLCQELGLRHAWLRLFSSYGPDDNSDWLIPYLINSLLARQNPNLTNAEQLWDYIYIEDVASAIKAVLENDEATGIFNLGSGRALSLRIMIEKIRDLIDRKLPLGFGEVPYRSDQVMHLEADIARLKSFTGWSPKFDFDAGIKKTVDWYSIHKS